MSEAVSCEQVKISVSEKAVENPVAGEERQKIPNTHACEESKDTAESTTTGSKKSDQLSGGGSNAAAPQIKVSFVGGNPLKTTEGAAPPIQKSPRTKDAKVKVRLGHYIFGKTLGTGSFGKVKLAEHEITGHKVAIKLLSKQKLASTRMDQKIKREIRILKLLRHPHIIRLYEVIETSTDIVMVMEYVAGGELFDYIVNHWPLPHTQVRRFFQQIVCAVEALHHFRVVHRDLKPENVLLDNDLNIKIADFGLSNMINDGDFLRTSCGSPNYAAPEVVAGKLYAGPEVDVWGIGVILYAMLCGRLPFDDESIAVLFRKIQEGRYVVPAHLPKPCVELITRMLKVDQLERMTISQIREHEWFREDLPDYMARTPEQQQNVSRERVDEELLTYVCRKMDIPFDIGYKALASGQKTDVSVTYYILLDSKLKQDRGLPSRSSLLSPSLSSLGNTPENSPRLLPGPIMECLMSTNPKSMSECRRAYNQPTVRQVQRRLQSCDAITATAIGSTSSSRRSSVASELVSSSTTPSGGPVVGGNVTAVTATISASFSGTLSASGGAGGGPGTPSSTSVDASGGAVVPPATPPLPSPAPAPPTTSGWTFSQLAGCRFPMGFPPRSASPLPPPPSSPIPALPTGLTPFSSFSSTVSSTSLVSDAAMDDIRANWRLGIFTQLPPNQAMKLIYKVLRTMRFVWRVRSPFELSCRHYTGRASTDGCVVYV